MRGLEAAGYTEDALRVGSGVALVGVGLPTLQECLDCYAK